MRMCLGLAAALCMAAPAGWAVDWKSLRPEGYVSDFAGVVDSASKAHLEAYAAELKAKTGAEIALVTIPSLEGEPLDDVAGTIARAWGVGQTGRKEGVLLLVAIHDRRSRIEIGDGLKTLLPGLEGSARRQMAPGLRSHQYGEALMAAAETFGTAISRASHVQIDASLPRHLRPTLANSLPILFVLIALSQLILFGCLTTWALRRRRTQSGGGFGNFDSSDSFGGFGGDGAPSGHGGAAGGW
jgi:uncharacterized protein